jgi:hypothetical protein
VRTAKRLVQFDATVSDRNLEAEIQYSANLAKRVLSALQARNAIFFPQKRKPWFMPGGEDSPK